MSRYPYTYACDLIRGISGYNKNGSKLSRSDASKIIQLFSDIIGTDEKVLAEKLADYYVSREEELSKQSVQNIMTALIE